MKILAIETSCDETAIAILDIAAVGKSTKARILANMVHSQIEIHAPYGGVFPSLAKREHAKNLVPLLVAALKKARLFSKKKPVPHKQNFSFAEKLFEKEPGLLEPFLKEIPNIKKPAIDAIAVTYGPGLEPALWVGINFAKALSLAWNIPIIPVNHMEGHLFSPFMRGDTFRVPSLPFPVLALLISGGHTELVLMKRWDTYRVIGQTRDDAVGEAFDKAARMLSLPYPGGPEVSKRAGMFDPSGKKLGISLPRPMLHSDDCNFSFSGLKTAVRYLLDDLQKKKVPLTGGLIAEICHEFESAAAEVIVSKTMRAISEHSPRMLLVGGGVSANTAIRKTLEEATARHAENITLRLPDSSFTGDNAAMIALAAYFKKKPAAKKMRVKTKKLSALKALGNVRIDAQKMPAIFLPRT
ncbi:MAG: tRNA (adenosine(37)-N6)-threonylcarbamoyltransferase complex transferase subunit TsaD [Candidatus Lloydbacteria bacterium]|nr:tRNA (adenosine(37)-N6)-threonylcarbamoyltransferase complex transferase subunit TsaD [Candidatus Lloydbacteria bacterium]